MLLRLFSRNSPNSNSAIFLVVFSTIKIWCETFLLSEIWKRYFSFYLFDIEISKIVARPFSKFCVHIVIKIHNLHDIKWRINKFSTKPISCQYLKHFITLLHLVTSLCLYVCSSPWENLLINFKSKLKGKCEYFWTTHL